MEVLINEEISVGIQSLIKKIKGEFVTHSFEYLESIDPFND